MVHNISYGLGINVDVQTNNDCYGERNKNPNVV